MLGIHEACRLFISIIDNNHLAWFYVTDIMSTHQIKGTGFTGNNPAMIKTSQTKRPKTIRITERNQFIITHDEDGKSTLDCIGSLRYALFQGLLRERAIRDRTTSLSTVVWNTCPSLASSCRRLAAFVKLPLWDRQRFPHHRTLSKAGHCKVILLPVVE